MRAWHFTTSAHPADGVTEGVRLAVDLFRELGLDAQALGEHIAPEMAGVFMDYREARPAPGDLLCFHHSIGVGPEVEAWLAAFPGRRWMAYHNITPPFYFEPGSPHHAGCVLGREQLQRWAGWFEASIADSAYNRRELALAGYANTEVLPLLVASDELAAGGVDAATLASLQGRFNLLFVGRLVANKCQHQLVDLLARLSRRTDAPLSLHLVGGTSIPDYESFLRYRAQRQGVADRVHLHGKVSAAVRNAYYAGADLYLSLSEHEGFGIPFLEAMRFGCPIAAFGTAAVPETVGQGGLLLLGKAAATVDEELLGLIESPLRRLALREAQPAQLARFTRAALRGRLRDFAARFLALPAAPPAAAPAEPPAAPTVLLEGPFDTAYSLAQVNREMARAAIRAGERVRLHSTEGGGDYAPDAQWMAREAADLLPFLSPQGEAVGARAALGLRNLYPPRIDRLQSGLALLGPYGWEESVWPQPYVDAVNLHAHGVLAMSSWVAKVLQDSGVRVPIEVTGLGVEPAAPDGAFQPALPGAGYLLHISSGFPRKGLDLLFAAFDDPDFAGAALGLVVKTFPNPHNELPRLVQAHGWREVQPVQPALRIYTRPGDDRWLAVFEQELAPAQVSALITRARVLVAPSRGEGFGLPMAEAMALGVPVVATVAGGQADFCREDTCWPVPVRHAPARTHLNAGGDALWYEPDPQGLVAAMRAALDAGPGDPRVARAREWVTSRFGWDAVWQRTRAFAQALHARAAAAAQQPPLRLALVSTWNSRCGIAEYSAQLAAGFPEGRWQVFANTDAVALGMDPAFVQRCWRTTAGDIAPDDLQALGDALLASEAGAVLIEFNFGFFGMAPLGRLVERLHAAGRAVLLQMHSTQDVLPPHQPKSLREIAPALALCRRLLVHSAADMDRLAAMGLGPIATLLPQGVPAWAPEAETGAPVAAGGGTLLATTGFLLPHKGLFELVEAFDQLSPAWPGLRLLLLTALHDAPASAAEAARLRERIARSPWASAIELQTDFLAQEEILHRLSQASAVVFPYRDNQESSSAALRLGLSAGRPVVVTPCRQFAEAVDVTYALPGESPEAMAQGLLGLRASISAHPKAAVQAAWVAARAWPRIGRRAWNLIQAVS